MLERKKKLLEGLADNTLTSAELAELMQGIRAGDPDFAQAIEELLQDSTNTGLLAPEREQWLFDKVMSRAHQEEKPVRRIPARIWRVAAAVTLLLGTTGVYVSLKKQQQQHTLAMEQRRPAANKAVLTLADGRQVELDSIGHQQLQQGNANIQQQNGQLKYESAATTATITYNQLSTPRGGQFVLLLPDGSKVWLNAASSIKFPVAFARERVVSITGEAYFEIRQDAAKPFIVNTSRSSIQVLGTAFNIMDYAEEGQQQTTLVSGAVKVTAGTEAVVLKPGKMAVVKENSLSVTDADTSSIMGWRTGEINVQGQEIAAVLRQISRLYNVDIEVRGTLPKDKLGYITDKNTPLSTMLDLLHEHGLQTKINGSAIIVTTRQ
ncbi:FecR family protein [Chitinophaga sp. sic0106]|uniref:FecR family protein n=1 Tax=Chitinophaga sp. sic0106 TaxID=2854785 RepID=UPI001C4690F4|nr:FecR family protein [Chitinophaga sp. sic0106]MBV7532556.1 FecR domain-containing protein [Chitinophaga sp. sic0106]